MLTVAAEVADAEPAGLDAVTVTSSALPPSPLATVYVGEVAPEIAAQLLPLALHLSH
jgi:hypothetical protein